MATFLLPNMPVMRAALSRACCTIETLPSRSIITSARLFSTSIESQCAKRASRTQCSTHITRQLATRRSFAAAAPVSPTTTQQTQRRALSASELLTWNEFFTIRRRRRFLNLGMSVVGGITAAILGPPLIGQYDIDTQVAEATGVDSLYILAGGSISIAALGWFLGRVVGGRLFSLTARSRGWRHVFDEKEKSLFHRIKRYRADPASSSPQNPIPDYYGEKIGSVAGYRRWLKDQRAFTKKMYRGTKPVAA